MREKFLAGSKNADAREAPWCLFRGFYRHQENITKLSNYKQKLKEGIGAEGENSTPLCFTGFFTYFSNILTK